MNEISVMGMMKVVVPITCFNKGEASRIFDEVQMSAYNPAENKSMQEMMAELGMTSEELEDVDVEIE